MTEVISITVTTPWGTMEEEEEEDRALPLPQEFVSASPNSRVRFAINRKVVRYPSEKSLMALDELPPPTVINDEDDWSDGGEDTIQENGEVQEDAVEEKEPPKQEETPDKVNEAPHASTPKEILKDLQEVSKETQPQERKGWRDRAAPIQRYTPRFAPPPPQPEENNGEDEEEEDDEEGGEDDEDGYDSVVEDEDAETADDPIKKIAEETIFSRQQKLQAIQNQQAPAPITVAAAPAPVAATAPPPASSKAGEQDEMLKTIAHIKDQLRDEVEKAEQASKAAAAAAQHALESNIQLSSRIANMRSFLAVLCGGC